MRHFQRVNFFPFTHFQCLVESEEEEEEDKEVEGQQQEDRGQRTKGKNILN